MSKTKTAKEVLAEGREKDALANTQAVDLNPNWMDEEQFENAEATIYAFESVGDTLEGTLEQITEFTEGTKAKRAGQKPCNRYVIKARDGIDYSCVGGQVLDSLFEKSVVNEGDYVRIKFNGKKKTQSGDMCNTWSLQFKRRPIVIDKNPL